MFEHYVKVAVRSLGKNLLHNLFIVLFVTIGLFVFSLSFYFIRETNNQYLAWENADNLATLYSFDETNVKSNGIQYEKMNLFFNDNLSGINNIALFSSNNNETINLRESDKDFSYDVSSLKVNEDFFSVYSILNTKISGVNNVVLSKSLANKIYGKDSSIGKSIYIYNSKNEIEYYKIVNVIDDLPNLTKEKADVYFVQNEFQNDEVLNVTLQLSENCNVGAINAYLKDKLFSDNNKNFKFSVLTFNDQFYSFENLISIVFAFIIFGLILISSMVVFVKFRIDSFVQRFHEVGIRRILGATQSNIYVSVIFEIVILLVSALLLVFCITELFLPMLEQYLPYEIKRTGWVDVNKLLLYKHEIEYLCILMIITLFFIHLFVSYCYSKNIDMFMRGSVMFKNRKSNLLLFVQMIITFCFIAMAINSYVSYYQLESIRNIPISQEDRRSVLWIPLDGYPQLQQNSDLIKTEIQRLNKIETYTSFNEYVRAEYVRRDNSKLSINSVEGDANYADFFKIDIKGNKPVREDEILVSSSFLSLVKEDGVDDFVVLNNNRYHIVGSFDSLPFELKSKYLKNNDQYAILFLRDNPTSCMLVKSDIGSINRLKSDVTKIIGKILPETLYLPILTLDRVYELRYYGLRNMMGIFLRVISFICILMMCISLYSAIISDLVKKEKEIAIRKIHGAGIKNIIRFLLYPYLKNMLLATLFSYPLIYLIIKISSNNYTFDFRLENSIVFWISLSLAMAIIVFVSLFYKLRLIATTNPIKMLHSK